ncbi:apelin receptor-like [Mya arenaria]|uniref:apelin receptor-like n=1 Tax=Mya arenaria TaxID=6604 RepID=UPI0022E98193|nr:apelin receptor-like [Mya arenaria]
MNNTTAGSDPQLPGWFLWGWPGCDFPVEEGKSPGAIGAVTFYTWALVPPAYLCLGTVGNFLTVLVISLGFNKIRSTDVMLLALAVSDTVFLYSTALRRWLMHGFEIDLRKHSDFMCKMGIFLTYVSFQFSSLMLVLLTGERVMCIVKPYSAKRICTTKTATFATMVMLIFLGALNSHFLYGFGTSVIDIYQTVDRCGAEHEDYFVFFEFYYSWVHFIVGYTFPCVCIIAGNVVIIRGLWCSAFERRWKGSATSQGSTSSQHRDTQKRSLTVMLVTLNVIFFVTQTPACVYIVSYAHMIKEANKFACTDFATYKSMAGNIHLMEALIHNLAYLNSAINFLLYVVSGTRFRSHVRALITCRQRNREPVTSLSRTLSVVNHTHEAFVLDSQL